MKKLILLFTIITSFNVQAGVVVNCNKLAGAANAVMEVRQSGMSMSQMFEISDGDIALNYLITKAFETSNLMQGVAQKQVEIVKFENLMFLTCQQLNELNKGK